MQQKIVIDTNVYIDIFNSGVYESLRQPFRFIVFLAYPVLHELWMGAKGNSEIKHLSVFQSQFIKLNRLILPSPATLTAIGEACHKLRFTGKLDPAHPKHYNDVTIAALARQVGAAVITQNSKDFSLIKDVLDFEFFVPAGK